MILRLFVNLIQIGSCYTGKIIAKHGLAAGVTKEMVAELDKEYGHDNPAESIFALRNAWHSARGYAGK